MIDFEFENVSRVFEIISLVDKLFSFLFDPIENTLNKNLFSTLTPLFFYISCLTTTLFQFYYLMIFH